MMSNETPVNATAASRYSVLASQDSSTGKCLAVDLLAAQSRLSKAKIKQAMAKGAVWREKRLPDGGFSKPRRLRRATAVVAPGDRLELFYNPSVLAATCAAPLLVANRQCYSVWDKPAGMLCQGSRWGDHLTLNRWAETHLPGKPAAFVVHRLDRMASGLVVLAHNKQAAANLSRQFAERKVTKRYQCIVFGQAPTRLPAVLDQPVEGKPALTIIEQAQPATHGLGRKTGIEVDTVEDSHEVLQGCTLLTVRIGTGRKHQIRQHLAAHGLPLLGDRQYGGAMAAARPELVRGEAAPDLQLRAVQLAFADPLDGLTVDWKLH